jgi:hypothetical protein
MYMSLGDSMRQTTFYELMINGERVDYINMFGDEKDALEHFRCIYGSELIDKPGVCIKKEGVII